MPGWSSKPSVINLQIAPEMTGMMRSHSCIPMSPMLVSKPKPRPSLEMISSTWCWGSPKGMPQDDGLEHAHEVERGVELGEEGVTGLLHGVADDAEEGGDRLTACAQQLGESGVVGVREHGGEIEVIEQIAVRIEDLSRTGLALARELGMRTLLARHEHLRSDPAQTT